MRKTIKYSTIYWSDILDKIFRSCQDINTDKQQRKEKNMSTNIAKIKISRRQAMDVFFSYERLKKTSKNPNGPLHRIIEWFKAENGRTFALKNMHLGKPEEDYVLIYYFESTRYKLTRDGEVVITTADADIFKQEVEKDFQDLIDTILNDELMVYIRKIVELSEAKASKPKYKDTKDDVRTQAVFGIQKM